MLETVYPLHLSRLWIDPINGGCKIHAGERFLVFRTQESL